MDQDTKSNDGDTQDEIQQLQKQLQATINATKDAEKQFETLKKRLEIDWKQRRQAGQGIINDQRKKTFQQLCDCQKWLVNNNINLYAADETSKVWFSSIHKIPFIVDQKAEKQQTPEFKEVTKYIQQMSTEWLNEYCIKWEAGNDARWKYQALPDKHKIKK